MIPVITVDGPSGSGKGTIAQRVAQSLGWHFLDSGAIYRALGLYAEQQGVGSEEVDALAALARTMPLNFRQDEVLLDGKEISALIRTEAVGNAASKVAAIPEVREALLEWQREFARAPGLVADGRDMGTVVFPNAEVKIFLTASPEERALRRYKQLKEKGLSANLAGLTVEIRERDERDCNRAVAPLKAAFDALELDSTEMDVDAVYASVMARVRSRLPGL
ncbi:(d)CMP kinase [endosymbiont of Ridgeia piscesae]|jgi:cytidylate kinase|uniref:Cytidylate kinase n=1 Tax=endosymbiont of Ridgeia piscesae TaxID=54398 RepID=A0A0T5Z1Z6_9GAMM|nr:(d)CMP kinase [endosymbiont of Ridgeia piscesae]KRT55966.1 cytidylate kinase [endosymbiont of Ridgeia piscesae]KRT56813.1 cytidylate kinase [endosymbiont of Ridgeia piscesae]